MYWWIKYDKKNFHTVGVAGNAYTLDDYLGITKKFIDKERVTNFEYDNNDNRKTGIFISSYYFSMLILHLYDYNLYKEIFEGNDVDLFRGSLEGRELAIIRINKEIDCFDYNNSVYDRFSYKNAGDDIMRIRKLYIVDDVPYAEDIFRLSGQKIMRIQMVVSDRFKDKYQEHGGTGLLFREAMLT